MVQKAVVVIGRLKISMSDTLAIEVVPTVQVGATNQKEEEGVTGGIRTEG